MADYLLDTNHATHLLAKDKAFADRLRKRTAPGDRFSISMTILGELYYAAYASRRKKQNLDALEDFLRDVDLLPFDEGAAEEFGRIQAEQKRKGEPIPPSDSQIAAVCRLHDLILLSDDRHFQFVDHLRLENWLRDTKTAS